MTTSAALRDRYRTDAVETMSPARLVVALYDRLVLDLERALAAIAQADFGAIHASLVHAQEIVTELHDALDVAVWPAGAQLVELYRYVHGELVAANVGKDAARVSGCRDIVTPLRDAWREAAGIVGRP